MSTHDSQETTRTEMDDESTADADTDPDANADDRLELATRVRLLEAENRRLRSEYARARQARYRRTALALAVLGAVALAGGALFPADRAVFVTLGAIGLFGAVLTYYLTPSQVVTAAVGDLVYTAGAANLAALADALGLQSERVYVPTGAAGAPRLFVPLYAAYDLPTDAEGPLVLEGDARGLLLQPSGELLVEEFDRAVTDGIATTPVPLAAQLCDALVEQFELATQATPDVDAAEGRVTVAISNSVFGAVDRFDHPIVSFLATGLAVGLDRPVTIDTARGDDRADWLVTCRFETEDPAE